MEPGLLRTAHSCANTPASTKIKIKIKPIVTHYMNTVVRRKRTQSKQEKWPTREMVQARALLCVVGRAVDSTSHALNAVSCVRSNFHHEHINNMCSPF